MVINRLTSEFGSDNAECFERFFATLIRFVRLRMILARFGGCESVFAPEDVPASPLFCCCSDDPFFLP